MTQSRRCKLSEVLQIHDENITLSWEVAGTLSEVVGAVAHTTLARSVGGLHVIPATHAEGTGHQQPCGEHDQDLVQIP